MFYSWKWVQNVNIGLIKALVRYAKGMVYYFFPNLKDNVVFADIIYTDLY